MLLSASQRATSRTPFIFLKALMWLSPRLRMPITATRISSFAPATCDHDRADQPKVALATMEFLRNVRRVNDFMGVNAELMSLDCLQLGNYTTFSGTTYGLRYSRVSIALALLLPRNFSLFGSILRTTPRASLSLLISTPL